MTSAKLIVAAAALAFAAAASAQGSAATAAPASPTSQASVADDYASGEIRKIDKDNGKVTLKHGEIKNLGMPPMAMVFEVRDRKMLDPFKVGDKVRFRATYESGKYVLRDMEAAK